MVGCRERRGRFGVCRSGVIVVFVGVGGGDYVLVLTRVDLDF